MNYYLQLGTQTVNTPIMTFASAFEDLRRQLAEANENPSSTFAHLALERYVTDTEPAKARVIDILSKVVGRQNFEISHEHDPRDLKGFVKDAKRSIGDHLAVTTYHGDGASVIGLLFDPNNPPDFAPSAIAEIQ